MIKYSQRNSEWNKDLMGTGTIGAFGCTITCLSMKSDIKPNVVNNEIKNVNGYSGNYLIWDKLDLIKGFDFIKRVKAYNNSDVAANLPCLVEVNGAPIGGTTHWVLYVGNQKLWDPWDGKEKPTSVYSPIGYAIVKYNSPYVAPIEPPKPVEPTVTPPSVPTVPEVPQVVLSTTPDVAVIVEPLVTPQEDKPNVISRIITWLISILESWKK